MSQPARFRRRLPTWNSGECRTMLLLFPMNKSYSNQGGQHWPLEHTSIEVSQMEKVNRTETSYLSICNKIIRLISFILCPQSTLERVLLILVEQKLWQRTFGSVECWTILHLYDLFPIDLESFKSRQPTLAIEGYKHQATQFESVNKRICESVTK